MKKLLILFLLISAIWSQCDANGDGDLNVSDIITQVNCILNNCWESVDVCQDIDGNVYQTIQIGNQLWMAENLKVTHYNNGDLIPNIIEISEWANTNFGAYCDYDNNLFISGIYGKLYNWHAVESGQGLCPDGWHVPSDMEWISLTEYLSPNEEETWGNSIAGGKMKESGHDHWNYFSDTISAEATNESGFTGLPGGYRYGVNGNYSNLGNTGYFWTSSMQDYVSTWNREIGFSSSNVYRNSNYVQNGYSVRCLAD